MQENLNSSSTSDDSIKKNNIALKEKANNILKQEIIPEKDSIGILKEIRLNPKFNLELEKKEQILSIDYFEIVNKQNINPVFLLNLINIVTIVNFAWSCTKKNIEKFHKILLNLNIMFSFVHRNEKDNTDGIDYVMLSSIPLVYYEYIAKY